MNINTYIFFINPNNGGDSNFLKKSYLKNVTFLKVTTKWRKAARVEQGVPAVTTKWREATGARAGCPCRYKSYLRDPIPIARTTWGCGS